MKEENITVLDKLQDLLGYVQNGSEREVNIFQDDATYDYHLIIIGSRRQVVGRECGSSLSDVINKAWLRFK